MDHNDEHANLKSAIHGFNRLFENDISGAKAHFATTKDDPYHLLGQGVCAFLEAALGMEAQVIEDARRYLTLAEAGTRKHTKIKKHVENHRFHPGLEWEILNADAVVLLGLVHALSETYTGYLQCLYSLNSAHSKFTTLYKTVFPSGIDMYLPPPSPPSDAVNHELLTPFAGSVSYSSASSAASSATTLPTVNTSEPGIVVGQKRKGLFSRWGSISSTPSLTAVHHRPHLHPSKPDGLIDDLIISGTAFGYGLFNLVFSLLPRRIQSIVGFFGFKSDRKLALKALSVAASRKDTHSVFARLVLMTYYGVILLLSGYQADESTIVRDYRDLVDRTYEQYPNGALWTLNKAKILRMARDPDKAINVLQEGLKPDRPLSFPQADSLVSMIILLSDLYQHHPELVFELAWTLLGQRRYQEAADTFLRVTELNTWSHATYYFIAAGCHWSLGNHERSQALFDAIPGLIDKKLGGKELPTEVFLKKKLEFYKEKQTRLGRQQTRFVEAITLSPSDEIAIFWNTHARISEAVALVHIREWSSTLPLPVISSPHFAPSPPSTSSDAILDTPDELALRSLLLGIAHRTTKAYTASRAFLMDACSRQNQIVNSTWIGGISMFELAVLELKIVEALISEGLEPAAAKEKWRGALKTASEHLDQAIALTTNSTDLSSRLDTRVSMLRDEIAVKKDGLGFR